MSIWQRRWSMSTGTHGLAGSTFTLQKQPCGILRCYVMNFDGSIDSERDVWSDCVFVRRGRVAFPWPGAPLEPFGADTSASYLERITDYLRSLTTAALRLEGELEYIPAPPNEPEGEITIAPLMVTLLIAPLAARNENGTVHDLLIVQVRSSGELVGFATGPDGTGHGDPT